jgi:hypothetical protein
MIVQKSRPVNEMRDTGSPAMSNSFQSEGVRPILHRLKRSFRRAGDLAFFHSSRRIGQLPSATSTMNTASRKQGGTTRR